MILGRVYDILHLGFDGQTLTLKNTVLCQVGGSSSS